MFHSVKPYDTNCSPSSVDLSWQRGRVGWVRRFWWRQRHPHNVVVSARLAGRDVVAVGRSLLRRRLVQLKLSSIGECGPKTECKSVMSDRCVIHVATLAMMTEDSQYHCTHIWQLWPKPRSRKRKMGYSLTHSGGQSTTCS